MNRSSVFVHKCKTKKKKNLEKVTYKTNLTSNFMVCAGLGLRLLESI